MLIQPYQIEELHFAWCYRVYCRWRTHRMRPEPALAKLTQASLGLMLEPYAIRVLEASAGETDVMLLASLVPAETTAGFVSKTKGRLSKWLREQTGAERLAPEKLLSRGYFACTTGQSTAEAVSAYLEKQGEHHGYLTRPCPPVFVARYPLTAADEEHLRPSHAVTVLRFHVVLATWKRLGVFGPAEAESTAERWREVQEDLSMVIEKVSFVADHVHLAVRAHPSMSPAKTIVALMNAAQERMWSGFADSVIRSRVERLWQPSAYLGSYGELESPKIAAYVRRWEQMREE